MKHLFTFVLLCLVSTGLAQKKFIQCGQMLDVATGKLVKEKTLVVEGNRILEVRDGYQDGTT
ncbi:MAG: amidohydrolase family protein, partial [Robiginitalea sp.]